MKEVHDLTFVNLKIPRLIPIDLIENVKGRTFTPEEFYKYQEDQVGNPYNHLYVLVDKDKRIHGYLWAESNILDKSLFINTFSISKPFWGKGKSIDFAVKFLQDLKKKLGSPRAYWCTTNERFFLKHGCKRSRIILMEYVEPISTA